MKSAELCSWLSIGETFSNGIFQIRFNHLEASPLAKTEENRVHTVRDQCV